MYLCQHIPLHVGIAIIADFKKYLTFPAKCISVGSIRRREKYSGDIDILLIVDVYYVVQLKSKSPTQIIKILSDGIRKKSFIVQKDKINYAVDIFLALPSEKPFALYHFTGPKSYNIRTRAYAKKRGLLLNQYGIFIRHSRQQILNINTEKQLTKFLEITYYPPSKRH